MLKYRPSPANTLGNSALKIMVWARVTIKTIKISITEGFETLTNKGIVDTRNRAITSSLIPELTPGIFKNSNLGINSANKIKYLYFTLNFIKKRNVHW